MTIYYLLIALVAMSSVITIAIKNKIKRNKVVVTINVIAIVLIQGLRDFSIGTDLATYIPAYKYALGLNFLKGEKLYNYELGYSLYTQLLARSAVTERQFLFITAAIIIGLIGYTLVINTKMPGMSIYIYITLGFFLFTFSGLRQSIAFAITFFSFKFIKDKKMLYFLFCIFFAVLFHTSAIVFVIAYPLYYLKIKREYMLNVLVILLITFLFKGRIFTLLNKLYYNSEDMIQSTGAYTMLFVMLGIYISVFLFCNDDKNYSLNAYKNYILVAIIFQIFASLSNTVMRSGYYYYMFITLLIPEVLMQLDGKGRLIVEIILCACLFYFYYNAISNGYLNVAPYKFYWEFS
jgi:hypothetical protein